MKVVVVEPLGVAQEKLDRLAEEILGQDVEVVYYDHRETDPRKLIARGEDAEAIIVANQPLSGEVIRGFRKLQFLSVAFTGYDHIDMEACREKGVVVSNCAGYSTVAVADLVFGMVISLYRRMRECDSVIRQGGTKDGLIGPELEGKKFGVIGTGAIGQRVATIANAFGCEVLAYSRSRKELPGVRYVELSELLQESDIISLHVPLTEQTKGLIGKEELAQMKKSAILINTARGPVVDSAALAEALKSGQIAGSGIDVFEQEPPMKDHPLYHTPNRLITPHIGFATIEALQKRAKIAYENIAAWRAGNPQNRVD